MCFVGSKDTFSSKIFLKILTVMQQNVPIAFIKKLFNRKTSFLALATYLTTANKCYKRYQEYHRAY